jgi:hypothetical protein
MPDPFTDGEGELQRAEHISPRKTGDNISAKRVATYVWNSTTSEWERMTQPGGSSSSSGKATDAYGIQAISDDGTYKYFFFEDASANYYVMRKHQTNSTFSYTKGTGGYSSVYQSAILGPSGTPTWADYGTTF